MIENHNEAPRWSRFMKWLLSILSSIALTIALLFLLIFTSILGTLIPQNMNQEVYIRKYGLTFSSLMNKLGLFDMYHSPLFLLLITLLMVNLVACSLKRWKRDWRIVRKKWEPRPESKNLNLIIESHFSDKPSLVMERLKGLFKAFQQRGAANLTDNNGIWWAGELGRWSRLSVYFVHFSIIVILLGCLLSLGLGNRGFMTIREGDTEDVFWTKGGEIPTPLDFKVRCNKFTLELYPNGMPKEYISDLTIIQDNNEVVQKAIKVNDPLKFNGITFYQYKYGSTLTGPVVLKVIDRRTGESQKIVCKVGEDVKLPMEEGTIQVIAYNDNFEGFGPALRLVLKRPNSRPEAFFIFKNIPNFDLKHRNDHITFVVDKVHTGFYTVLEVKKDPGVPVVYAGFIMFIVSLFLVFYFSHQKIAISVVPSENGSCARIYGSAHKGNLAYVQKIRDKIGKLTLE